MQFEANKLAFILQRASIAVTAKDPWIKWHNHLIHWVDDVCKLGEDAVEGKMPESLLDVATGIGSSVRYLAEKWPECRFDACDIFPLSIEVARILSLECGLENICYKVCPAENLSYDSHSFDVLTCFFSIMYFNEAKQAISEFFRVVRPGGKILIAVWAGNNELIDTIMTILNINKNETYPEGRNPYAFADEKVFTNLLTNQAVKGLSVKKNTVKLKWQGDEEELWNFFKCSNPALVSFFSGLPDHFRLEQENAVIATLSTFKTNNEIRFFADTILYSIGT